MSVSEDDNERFSQLEGRAPHKPDSELVSSEFDSESFEAGLGVHM